MKSNLTCINLPSNSHLPAKIILSQFSSAFPVTAHCTILAEFSCGLHSVCWEREPATPNDGCLTRRAATTNVKRKTTQQHTRTRHFVHDPTTSQGHSTQDLLTDNFPPRPPHHILIAAPSSSSPLLSSFPPVDPVDSLLRDPSDPFSFCSYLRPANLFFQSSSPSLTPPSPNHCSESLSPPLGISSLRVLSC